MHRPWKIEAAVTRQLLSLSPFFEDVTKVLFKRQGKLRHYSIVPALFDRDLDPKEIMMAYDIYPHLGDLEPGVAAFVYRSRKDRFYIIINASLSYAARLGVFFHELYHILEHVPRQGHILMDMKRYETEE